MDKPQCKYGEMCFRLNPSHFEQYSHQHLTEILKTEDKDGKYTIPEDLELNADKINQQLAILKNIQKNNKRLEKDELKLPVAKVSKIDTSQKGPETVAASPLGIKNIKVEPNSPSSFKSFGSPKVPSSPFGSPRNSSAAGSSKISSYFDASPKPSTSSQKPSTSTQKNSLSTPQVKVQDVKDFFKERAMMFNAKNPEEMRAKTPPKTEQKPRISDEQLEAKMREFLPVVLPRGRMAEKLKNAAPYNIFLTTITAAPKTHNDPLSVTFQELLDPSLGELESSVQFNFMIDIAWLLAQYTFARARHLPLLVLYGSDMEGIADINKKMPNVTTVKVPILTPYGCHHTKMMFLFYKDGSMRIVVSTANLYEDDWHNRVQGLWISDKLPALPDGVSHAQNGESETNFRSDLLTYLHAYNIPKLQPIIARIRSTDFSSVKVFFVASVPGTYNELRGGYSFGHPKVGKLLSENSAPIDDTCPIIIQASSIGNLGPQPHVYLLGEIAQTFKRDSAPVGIRRQPPVKLIYPSLNNVLNSHDKMLGGGCLPYDGKINEKQLWLKQFLYQWRASSTNRNQAMPHIKSYCRYSDRGLYWFILTSANISRSAWGSLNKSKNLTGTIRINSYEAGVMFFPRILIEKNFFPMNEQQKRGDEKIFKLPFDIPPVPYGHDDIPFTSEYLQEYLLKNMGKI